MLTACGYNSFFDVIVSGEDVTSGKPDPEMFLACASLLDVSENETVILNTHQRRLAARNGGFKADAITSFNEEVSIRVIIYFFRLPAMINQ